MTTGTLVIWSLSHLDNGTHIWMGLTGVRAPVWTASGMGHWKRLIKIPCGTDCYYCINNMTCPIHVSYWLLHLLLVLIIYPLSCYLYTLLHFLIHVTLSVRYSCTSIFCIAYTLLYVYLANIIIVYAQSGSMVLLHAAHLHVPYLLYKTGYYCRHDPMITC